MSTSERETGEATCPVCGNLNTFKVIHPKIDGEDCFIGAYVCNCGSELMMDYDADSDTFVAREIEDWREWMVGKEAPYKEGVIYAVKHIEDPTNVCRRGDSFASWSICVYRNNQFHHTGDCDKPILQYENDEILQVHEVTHDANWIGVNCHD